MSNKNNRRKRPPAPGPKATGATEAAAKTGKGYTPKKGSSTPRTKVPARPVKQRSTGAIEWVVLVGVIVVIIGAVFYFTAFSGESEEGITAANNWDLPALEDTDDDGRLTLSEFEGKPTIVNFFASWCVECDRELPDFVDLANEYGDDINVVFANSNETGNWQDMANDHGIREFPIVKDIGGPQGNGLYRAVGGPGGMPITAFYDANGELVFMNPGGMTFATVEDRLTQLGLLDTAQ
jgi:thiol-disulfide isomerase/thioredoxin